MGVTIPNASPLVAAFSVNSGCQSVGSAWSSNVNVYPRRVASILAISIFAIPIMASKARLAAAGSEPVIAAIKARGVICHDSPHRSLHQPQALS